MAVGNIALGIADEEHAEHINLLRVELRKGGECGFLLRTSCLADDADGSGRCTPLGKEEFAEAVELPVATVGARVVDGGDEVALGSCTNAAFDERPWSHQVRQGDEAQVVSDGSPQQGGCFLERRDARQAFDFQFHAAFALHLIDEGSHSVDAGIAGGDDDHRAAFLSQAESLLGTFALALHSRVDALAALLQIGLDEAEVVFVAHDDVGLTDGGEYGRRHVFRASRAEARNDDFLHSQSYFRHKDTEN